MLQKEMIEFLGTKDITVSKTEGDDFSSIFHISNESRKKIEENKSEWEKETGLMIEPSDMFGMSVVIMENVEDEALLD